MRRLPIALAVLVPVLALAPAAQAKGPISLRSVKVCGPSGCRDLPTGGRHEALAAELFHGGRIVAPAPLGPYYELRTKPAFEGLFFVPGGPALSTGVSWGSTSRATIRSLQRAASGLEPFRPRVSGADVGLRHVRGDAAAYGRLFDRMPAAHDPPYAIWTRRWLDVRVVFSGTTPWSGHDAFRFDPKSGLVFGSQGGWRRPPAALVARMRRDAGVAQPVAGSGHRGRIAVASVAALAVASSALWLARRRRTHDDGGPA